MKIIDLQQNTPEWLEFRRSHIGASDAPIILGVSPFKTPYQLYLDKVEGIEQHQNQAMKRGHDLEPEARAAFEEMYHALYGEEIHVVPMVVQSEDCPWMIASLDGIDLDKQVLVELKSPGQKDHDIALSGQIPEHYIPQLEQQIWLTGYQRMYYFSYRPGQPPALLEYISKKEVREKLHHMEFDFWNCISTKTPPPLLDKDFEERTDFGFVQAAMRYSEVKAELEQKLAEELKLKDELIKLAANRNCRGGRVKISQCSRRGNIDYSKIEQLSGIDLEAYRKPGTKYTTVSVC